jgi:hypothetical protein
MAYVKIAKVEKLKERLLKIEQERRRIRTLLKLVEREKAESEQIQNGEQSCG